MSRELQKLPWDDDYVRAVPIFDFGHEYWEREIERWIKDEVIEARREWGTDVWLYATEDDGLIGFGSLGQSRWNWPLATSKRVPISLIPAVGIHRPFQGQPRDGQSPRFSDQILDHLIYEAQQHSERHRALGLFVHPENSRAIKVYERAGFTRFSQVSVNDDGIKYASMMIEW